MTNLKDSSLSIDKVIASSYDISFELKLQKMRNVGKKERPTSKLCTFGYLSLRGGNAKIHQVGHK